MVKTLRILNLSLGGGKAGSGVFAVSLARQFVKAGQTVIQACSSGSITLASAEKEGLQTHIIDIEGLFELKKAAQLARFSDRNRIDVINVHHSRERYLAIFAKMIFHCDAKIVITRHAVSGTVPFFGSLIYNWGADMNIAVSQVVLDSLEKDFTLKKRLILGGIDLSKISPPRPEYLKHLTEKFLPGEMSRPIIGMVADYDPYGKNTREHGKGHDVLFKAMKQVSKDVLLLLIGPDLKDCSFLMKLGLMDGIRPDQIKIIPFQEYIFPFYFLMDIHVLPSYSESLGLVNLEAMAAGIPCIGTNIGGINEIIHHEENGLLFAKGNASDLAIQINRMLDNDQERNRMALSGKRRVETFFNMDRVANETLTLFRELVENG